MSSYDLMTTWQLDRISNSRACCRIFKNIQSIKVIKGIMFENRKPSLYYSVNNNDIFKTFSHFDLKILPKIKSLWSDNPENQVKIINMINEGVVFTRFNDHSPDLVIVSDLNYDSVSVRTMEMKQHELDTVVLSEIVESGCIITVSGCEMMKAVNVCLANEMIRRGAIR